MTPADANPLGAFLRAQGAVVLDGGLATTLESHGRDLNDPLWSARVILEDPDALARVHTEFLEAGADVIATATYQATLEGFMNRGLSREEAVAAMEKAVEVAVGARDRFWETFAAGSGAVALSPSGKESGRRLRPLVAASIGPYGAYLADGSEYTGAYPLDETALAAFHRPRWEILAASDADLLACETIPSGPEVRALLRLLDETPDRWAWISVQCRDARTLADGTPLEEAAALCDAVPHVAAVGVNCVSPDLVSGILQVLRGATEKPVAVYPNSGEGWDGRAKRWTGRGVSLVHRAREWREEGARVLGGCCRVSPSAIGAMRRELMDAGGGDGPAPPAVS